MTPDPMTDARIAEIEALLAVGKCPACDGVGLLGRDRNGDILRCSYCDGEGTVPTKLSSVLTRELLAALRQARAERDAAVAILKPRLSSTAWIPCVGETVRLRDDFDISKMRWGLDTEAFMEFKEVTGEIIRLDVDGMGASDRQLACEVSFETDGQHRLWFGISALERAADMVRQLKGDAPS